MAHLLFDVGGTRIRIGISSDLQQIDKHQIVETPASFQEGIAIIVSQLKQIAGTASIESIVGGLPGPINVEQTGMWQAPNLPAWRQQDIKTILQHEFPTAQVELRNDTYLVGLGEVLKGVSPDQNRVGYIGIGTGCGGACYDMDRIDLVQNSEPGHQLIPVGNAWVELEDLIGGAGLMDRFRVDEAGLNRTKIKNFATTYAAVGIYNVNLIWNAQSIVVGGGMLEKNIIEFMKLKIIFEQLPAVFPTKTKLVAAQLGSTGGLWGGMEVTKKIIKHG